MTRQLDRSTLLTLALVAAASLASGCGATPDATSTISQGIEGGQTESGYPAVGYVEPDLLTH